MEEGEVEKEISDKHLLEEIHLEQSLVVFRPWTIGVTGDDRRRRRDRHTCDDKTIIYTKVLLIVLSRWEYVKYYSDQQIYFLFTFIHFLFFYSRIIVSHKKQ